MKVVLSTSALVLLLLLSTATSVGAQTVTPTGELVYAFEVLGHADGTVTYRELVHDHDVGGFSAITPQANGPRPPRQEDLQRLLVWQSSKFRRSTAQSFRWAEKIVAGFPSAQELKKNRPRVRQTMNIVHQRRGHLQIPKFVLSNQKLAVRDFPDTPQGRIREDEQFDFDNKNVIVRTSDNRFFRFTRPDVITNTRVFQRGTCTPAGNIFRCFFSITECDIYLRAAIPGADFGFFEDNGGAVQKQLLAASFKTCQGHRQNTWSHDLTGTRNREVSSASFDKKNSRLWLLEQEEDQALYREAGELAIPKLPGKFLLPRKGSVIDLGHVKPPKFDPTRTLRDNAFTYAALAVTDLKGFKRAKDLTLEIFRGKSTRVQDRILGKLRGNSFNRDITVSGRPGFVRYFLSYLHISRDADFNKLLNVLRQPENQGKTIRGIGYDYALEVTIKVTGYEKENGKRKTVTNCYWLVWNEGEERDPEVFPVRFRK